ncbi:hypothetical protein HRbin16_00973 [bacterium HR16]|nr:hypothetical protein HRbin16_00973 [bacterium HR16]
MALKVVSNTSPIMNLARVGHLYLLERLYLKVSIPEAVFHELQRSSDLLGNTRFESLPWLDVSPVNNRLLVDALLLELHRGEAEAIALAVENKADLLLIDERIGRRVAERMGLRFIGVLGVLIQAKEEGIIRAVKPVLDSLITQAGFWVGSAVYTRVLQEAKE